MKNAKNFLMQHVSDNVAYLGMKGMIDLRVANILAKQAAMQQKAALFQSHIAQHESDRAGLYTAKADKMEEAYKDRSYDPNDESKNAIPAFNPPHSSVWYSPWGISHLQKGKTDPTLTGFETPAMASISCPADLLTTLFIRRSTILGEFI